MVLYVSVVEIAELAALPEAHFANGRVTGPVGAQLLAIVWGTAVGLAIAHWFAFRLAAPAFRGERPRATTPTSGSRRSAEPYSSRPRRACRSSSFRTCARKRRPATSPPSSSASSDTSSPATAEGHGWRPASTEQPRSRSGSSSRPSRPSSPRTDREWSSPLVQPNPTAPRHERGPDGEIREPVGCARELHRHRTVAAGQRCRRGRRGLDDVGGGAVRDDSRLFGDERVDRDGREGCRDDGHRDPDRDHDVHVGDGVADDHRREDGRDPRP